MIKAKSRIKKQVRSRDVKGKFTSRMSGKERLFILAILLGTMLWGYSNHSNYNISADTSVHIVEPGEPEPDDNPVQIQEVIVPEPKEVTEKQQIIDYIVKVFGNDAPEMIWIAECESKLDPSRIGDKDLMSYDAKHDEMVGDSIGVLQIRTGGKGWNRARANGMTAAEFRTYLLDWKNNIDYAETILNKSGFSPWTCARRTVL